MWGQRRQPSPQTGTLRSGGPSPVTVLAPVRGAPTVGAAQVPTGAPARITAARRARRGLGALGLFAGPQITATRSRAGDGRRPATTGQRHPGQAQPGQPGSGPAQPQSALRRAWQRFVTALAAVGAFLAKFGALLLKVKYVGLVLSMLVSIVAYSLFFGWSFAVGIVLLILVHEMGHVIELRRQGVPASAPLFIPFLGAFVNMRGSPRSAYQEALSGLAGPLVGTAASVVVAFWANATGSNFLMALAFFGFFVNLFNLLPVLPLDGGRAAAALHPGLVAARAGGPARLRVPLPEPGDPDRPHPGWVSNCGGGGGTATARRRVPTTPCSPSSGWPSGPSTWRWWRSRSSAPTPPTSPAASKRSRCTGAVLRP